MKTVLKYIVPVDGMVTIDAPGWSGWATVNMQNGIPTVWAICDLVGAPCKINLMIYGTGDNVPSEARFVGTVFDGPHVRHIFEIPHMAPPLIGR